MTPTEKYLPLSIRLTVTRQKKLALWANILRAELLVERLGEKQERGRQFEEIVNLDEEEYHRMETYKKDYKKLEAKLTQVVEKIKVTNVEK